MPPFLRLLALLTLTAPWAGAYEPTPENLAAREAFQDAKFGVFLHWGVYSVLERGEWVMNIEKIPISEYQPLAARFNPTDFDPDAWCQLFKDAGAGYITITSKHHDGFCMWDTAQTDWDIVERTPYRRDVLKDLAAACERHGLKLFFYYSQLDWHHPEYFPRGMHGRTAGRPESGDFNRYVDYMNAQLTELLGGAYGDVAGVWFDGWWDQQSKRFEGSRDAPVKQCRVEWRLPETYALIHRLRPTALVAANHHVEPFDGEDYQVFENDLPGENRGGHSADAVIGSLPLETCETINRSWGYNAGDNRHKSVKDLVRLLVRAAGANANLLLNVGPKPDGTIDDISAGRLRGVGEWLSEHGESIYKTRRGPVVAQPWGVTTAKPGKVYLHLLAPPEPNDGGWVTLTGAGSLADLAWAELVGQKRPVATQTTADGQLQVRIPEGATGKIDWVLVADAN